MAKLLTWLLVPSFPRHNLCLEGLKRCLLIVVMTFTELNSPSSQDKFLNMLYRHVFDKISSKFCCISWIYLNFEAPRPTRNITSPVFWAYITPILVHAWSLVLRDIYLISLTGQKWYVTELIWIWPVIMSGDSPEIFSSPDTQCWTLFKLDWKQ